MIGTLNVWVTKVVDTVSGPIHSWGRKPSVEKVVVKKVVSKKGKKSGSKKCRRC
jgi:hypothetical protein